MVTANTSAIQEPLYMLTDCRGNDGPYRARPGLLEALRFSADGAWNERDLMCYRARDLMNRSGVHMSKTDLLWDVQLPQGTRWVDRGNSLRVDKVQLSNGRSVETFFARMTSAQRQMYAQARPSLVTLFLPAHRTTEMRQAAVRGDVRLFTSKEMVTPEERMDYGLRKAFIQSGGALGFLEPHERTEELCIMAVKLNVNALRTIMLGSEFTPAVRAAAIAAHGEQATQLLRYGAYYRHMLATKRREVHQFEVPSDWQETL